MTERLREDGDLRRSTQTWMTVGVVLLLLLVLAFPIYKVLESHRRATALEQQDVALVTSGRQLFAADCATCHGTDGQGGIGPALNSKEFLGSATDAQIQGIVAGGIPGTAMPAWLDEYGGPLTDQEIANIVAYVRSWEKTAPSVPNWRTPQGG